MIVVCKSCGTKFKISKEAIGDNGRFVRCSVCDYEWLAQSDDLLDKITSSNRPTIPTMALRNTKVKVKPKQDLNSSLKQSWLKRNISSSEEEKSKFFIIILSLFFLVITPLIFFIWSLEHPEQGKNIPFLAGVYQRIGLPLNHLWQINNLSLSSQENTLLLKINISNLSEAVKVIDRMRIIVMEVTNEILSDSTVEPHQIVASKGYTKLYLKLPLNKVSNSKQLLLTIYINKKPLIEEQEITIQ